MDGNDENEPQEDKDENAKGVEETKNNKDKGESESNVGATPSGRANDSTSDGNGDDGATQQPKPSDAVGENDPPPPTPGDDNDGGGDASNKKKDDSDGTKKKDDSETPNKKDDSSSNLAILSKASEVVETNVQDKSSGATKKKKSSTTGGNPAPTETVFDPKKFSKGTRNGDIFFGTSTDEDGNPPLRHRYVSNFKETQIKLYRCIRDDQYDAIAEHFDGLDYYTAISDPNSFSRGQPLVLGMFLNLGFTHEGLIADEFIFCGCVTLNQKLFFIVYHPQLGEEENDFFISLGSRAGLKFHGYSLTTVAEAKELRKDLLSALRVKNGQESKLRSELLTSGNSMKPFFEKWKSKQRKIKTDGKKKAKTQKEKNKDKYQQKKAKKAEEKSTGDLYLIE